MRHSFITQGFLEPNSYLHPVASFLHSKVCVKPVSPYIWYCNLFPFKRSFLWCTCTLTLYNVLTQDVFYAEPIPYCNICSPKNGLYTKATPYCNFPPYSRRFSLLNSYLDTVTSLPHSAAAPTCSGFRARWGCYGPPCCPWLHLHLPTGGASGEHCDCHFEKTASRRSCIQTAFLLNIEHAIKQFLWNRLKFCYFSVENINKNTDTWYFMTSGQHAQAA